MRAPRRASLTVSSVFCTPTIPDAPRPRLRGVRGAAERHGCPRAAPHRAVEQKIWGATRPVGPAWHLGAVHPRRGPPPCGGGSSSTPRPRGAGPTARVCEIGMAASTRHGSRVDEAIASWTWERAIPSDATAVHGITNGMVRQMPRLRRHHPAGARVDRRAPLSAHNARASDRARCWPSPAGGSPAPGTTRSCMGQSCVARRVEAIHPEPRLVPEAPAGTAHRALGDVRTTAALTPRLYGLTRALPKALSEPQPKRAAPEPSKPTTSSRAPEVLGEGLDLRHPRGPVRAAAATPGAPSPRTRRRSCACATIVGFDGKGAHEQGRGARPGFTGSTARAATRAPTSPPARSGPEPAPPGTATASTARSSTPSRSPTSTASTCATAAIARSRRRTPARRLPHRLPTTGNRIQRSALPRRPSR